MAKIVRIFSNSEWLSPIDKITQQQAINELENGKLLYFPELSFSLKPEEGFLLSPKFANPKAKNISYCSKNNSLGGVSKLSKEENLQLKAMLQRFSLYAFSFMKELFPHYEKELILARTSFRPLQIAQRKSSYRKDDKLLHVDAFSSSPNQGKRILRLFCNINPNNEDRVWRIGESFVEVAQRFAPKIRKPILGSAMLYKVLGLTKSYRSLYDHYMLNIHNNMKADKNYQKEAKQKIINFPSACTWIVLTDQVSHAAMYGQYTLEQTFYLPVNAMLDNSQAPLNILARVLGMSAEELIESPVRS